MTATERYRSFRIGFIAGAGARPKATRFDGHELEPDYLAGYESGRRARHAALSVFAAGIGYDAAAEILREGGAQ